MGRFVTIAKAAQLAGTSVTLLRQEIQSGVLPSVRGMVHVDDLIEQYPGVQKEDTDMLLWVNKIKDHASDHNAMKPRHQLSRNELLVELDRVSNELDYFRNRSGAYKEVISELRDSLLVLQKTSDQKNRIQGLIDWAEKKLSE